MPQNASDTVTRSAGMNPTSNGRPFQADVFRVCGRTGWRAAVVAIARYRGLRVMATLRLCQALQGSRLHPLLLVAKALHRVTCHLATVDLPWRTSIGPGLALTHSWGTVVNGDARIGVNVTMFHGVTVGRQDRIDDQGMRTIGYPTIEDEVWIGPHAVIVGGITIGKGSRIAANAVVTFDVGPASIVAGNPAVITKTDCRPDVLNRYPIDATVSRRP